MKKIQRRAFLCVGICLFLTLGMFYFLFEYATKGDQWFLQRYNRHLYSDQQKLMSGTIEDVNGVLLSQVHDGSRVFSTDKAVRIANLHVVGDAHGNIGTAALSLYADYLVSYSSLSGAGGITEEGNHLTLTVDSHLNVVAKEALEDHTGCIAIYNYKTGEIICLVSTPDYDPDNVPEDLESNPIYDGAYLNRFYSSTFRPGSIIKLVTLEAALCEIPDAETRTYTCTGSLPVGDNIVTCERAHGKMTLADALACSCNCVFADLSVELGGETLQRYIRKAGLTHSYTLDGLHTAKGSFELATVTEYQLGWAGVGLYHDLVNPCSMLIYLGSIAGDGRAALPTTLQKVTTASGKLLYEHKTEKTTQILSTETADKLRSYMKNNAAKMYDLSRFPTTEIAAKSGTIETKNGKSNCWFAGFLTDSQMPYAFLVYMENAGSGNRIAGSVAAKVLHALYETR